MAAIVYVSVPGLLGTLRNLFTDISSDSSAASRTGSYDLGMEMISRAPWFGRGYGTFLPKYRIFDNQLLLTAVEAGLVGLALLLVLLVTPIVAAMRVRKATSDPAVRQLASALAAGVAATACSFAFYDALAFPMATSIMFLLIGAVGCLVRLSRSKARAPRPS
jgi:O-antigen ligase